MRLYDVTQKKEAGQGGESGSSGRRSQIEEGGRGLEPGRPVCRPSKVVSGSAIFVAGAAADHSQLDPVSLVRLKAEDPTGTRAAAEADKVRLCAAAIARYQYEKRTAVNRRPEFAESEPAFQYVQIQKGLDRLERIEPWPGASLEDLKLMYGMLDYSEDHVHVR